MVFLLISLTSLILSSWLCEFQKKLLSLTFNSCTFPGFLKIIIYMNYVDNMKKILDTWVERLNAGSIPCHIAPREGLRKMIPRHIFHDYPEVFLQTKGFTNFSFPGSRKVLPPGEVLIVPPEVPHGESIERIGDDFETLVITPATNYVQCHLSHAGRDKLPVILHYETYGKGEQVSVRQMTDLLVEKSVNSSIYSPFILKGLLLSLFASVRILLEGAELKEEVNPRIRHVKNAVLYSYHDSSLRVAGLAQLINCTPDYLSWLFHRETGMTLTRYINSLRLNRAVDLLKNTDYSVSEIAWICGYKNPAYFSRIFSREYGKSPGKFRRVQ